MTQAAIVPKQESFTRRLPVLLSLLLFAPAAFFFSLSFLSLTTSLCAVSGFLFALSFAFALSRSAAPHRGAVFAGFIAFLCGFHYLPAVLHDFTGYSLFFCTLIWIVFAAYSSLQLLLVSLLHRTLLRSNAARLSLALPFSWFAAEIVFPNWLPIMLGCSQAANPWLRQLADLGGVPWISFFMLWWAALALDLLVPQGKKPAGRGRKAAALAASLVLVFAYGGMRADQVRANAAHSPQISVAVVQGNLGLLRDFVAEKKQINLERYRQLSRPVLREKKPQLLIWPETAVGYDFLPEEKAIAHGDERQPFPGLDIPLIFGGQTNAANAYSQLPVYYNSVFALEPAGGIAARYDKQQLFPIAEKTMFGELLSGRAYSVAAGERRAPLMLQGLIRGRPVKAAAVVCYEDMWPKLYRTMLHDFGADFLLSLSNDAWFGQSWASKQHEAAALFRAIEFRRYFIRATNNGATAVIDPLGNVAAELPRFAEGVLFTDQIRLLSAKTFFQVAGNYLNSAAALLIILVVLAKIKVKRSGKRRRRTRTSI